VDKLPEFDVLWNKFGYLKEELIALDLYLKNKLPRRGGILYEVSGETVFSGGKRLRPALVILCGMLGTYDREKIFPIAAAIEMLHTATLVHDDIIDNAKTRRGYPSVSEKHSINMAIYTGDFLLVESVLLLAEAGLPQDKLEYVARAVRLICLGEVNQYMTRFKLTTINGYLRRIMKKTGILFSASCALGAFAGGSSNELIKTLSRLGMYLGVAFQINDDIIDLESSEYKAGKPVGSDIREGLATLPYLYAVKQSEKVRMEIEEFFSGISDENDVIKLVRKTSGLEDTRKLKQTYIAKCRILLGNLPESEGLNALNHLLVVL
jgi:heptaprenyl diphosphate synthase